MSVSAASKPTLPADPTVKTDFKPLAEVCDGMECAASVGPN